MIITCEMAKNIICVMFCVYVLVLYVVDCILATKYAKKLNRSLVGYLFLSIFCTPLVSTFILLIVGYKTPKVLKAKKNKIVINVYK